MKEQRLRIGVYIFLVLIATILPIAVHYAEDTTIQNYSQNIYSFEAANALTTYTLEEVRNGQLEFVEFQETRVPYSFSKNDTWIRMKFSKDGLQMNKNMYGFVFDNGNTDYIDAYLPINENGEKKYQLYEKGLMRNLHDYEVSNNKWNIIIPKDIIEDEYIYILVKSNVDVDIQVSNVLTTTREATRRNLYFGIFFGFLLSFIVIGLLGFTVVHKGYYIYYVLYVICMLLYQMRIHCYLSYFISVSYDMYMRLLWVFVMGMFFFGMMFTVRFLGLKKHVRVMDIAIKVVFSTAVITSFIGVLGYYKTADSIMHIVQVLCPFFVIVAAMIRRKQGYSSATIFMLGWMAITVSSAIWSFAIYLPAEIPTNYILQMGFIVEALMILLSFVKELQHIFMERERLELLSSRDSLTNFFNKRVLLEKIRGLIEGDGSNKFSIIIIDIDNFKEINDELGHVVGDKILVRIAEIIRLGLRRTDIPCRYGGDEMLIILPNTDEIEAFHIAERIRKMIYAQYKEHKEIIIPISVSIGVARHENGETYETLVEKVDQALYDAKEQGKNRTIRVAGGTV